MKEEMAVIHGDEWKYKDVEEPIKWARSQTWEKKKWKPRPALVSSSEVSDYTGQKYDSESFILAETGWTHDHCEICWWEIRESDEEELGIGFTTDGHSWVCSECYHQFIENKGTRRP